MRIRPTRPAAAMSGRRSRNPHRVAGAAVVLAAALVALFGFLTWAVISNGDAPSTTLNGWGLIGGPGAVGGRNINDVIDELDGVGTYRPALLATLIAGLVLPAGGRLLFTPSKIAAAVGIGGGIVLLGWGLYRAVNPGTVAGIVAVEDIGPGPGPWLVGAAGGVVLAAAAVVLASSGPGRDDGGARGASRSRGIQPG